MNNFMFSPNCIIPNIKWKDADELFVEAGRYPLGGHRYDGQYQNLAGLHKFLDVPTRTAVDIDGTYSVGTTSGMIGGAKVNSSWYSVFLMTVSAGTPIVLVLPYLRVDNITYGAPSTTINPAAHADGTTAADGFIVANDAWNDYRLVKLDIEDTTYDGTVYTIADCTTATPDTVVITGDITSQVAAADWLQLIPPAGTDCCYLGTIFIDGSGNLKQFRKIGWRYDWTVGIVVNMVKNTTASNTEIATAIPPSAVMVSVGIYVYSDSSDVYGVDGVIYNGSSGANTAQRAYSAKATAGAYMNYEAPSTIVPITNTSLLRNKATQANTSWVWAAATTAEFKFRGWFE